MRHHDGGALPRRSNKERIMGAVKRERLVGVALAYFLVSPSAWRLGAQTIGTRLALSQRIIHTEPSKYRDVSKVHGGAGALSFMALLGPDDLNVNLIFVHRGVLQPKSGIGHHFHNQMEEMFIIFDNRA